MSLAADNPTNVDGLMTISRFSIAAQASDVILCGLALLVVRGIHERLEQRAASRAGSLHGRP
jgi:hypothetical protein